MAKVNLYKEHIDALCEKHQITIGTASARGRAFRKSKRINIKPVKSSVTYAIALHEIGHIVGKQGKYRLEKERNAWCWALENSLEWNDTMQKTMQSSLDFYQERASKHKTMREE